MKCLSKDFCRILDIYQSAFIRLDKQYNSSFYMFVDPSRPADSISSGGNGGSGGAILHPDYTGELPAKDRLFWLWYALNMVLVVVCLALNALLSTVLIVERQRNFKFRVWSSPDNKDKRGFALKASVKFMETFEKYFGINDVLKKQG
ncbi:hypothetical protein Y032_0481g2254 [Ancylostoma ceylanicum]|uniref:Uncharacterized protein n=1 Tax=Ancylostoma ceylanicum TaxID=53326 RepID=A0A016WVC3_9BILA|nr:hypothetical protein Y032_0481g2254 [Ancylostoma ceylanicum]